MGRMISDYELRQMDIGELKKTERIITMPRFCECGSDMYICQKCGRDLCSTKFPPEWRPDITKNEHAGNVCPQCIANSPEEGHISLYDHCRAESGFTEHGKIMAYMNRYYGHG